MEHFHCNCGGATCLAPSALDNIFKDAEVLLPPGGERRGETCLGSLNVSPFDPVKTFQTRLPGLLRSQPGLGVGGRDNRSRVPGVPPDLGASGHLKPRKMPGLAGRLGRVLPLSSSLLPAPPARRPRRVFELARGVGEGARGRDGRTSAKTPDCTTAASSVWPLARGHN